MSGAFFIGLLPAFIGFLPTVEPFFTLLWRIADTKKGSRRYPDCFFTREYFLYCLIIYLAVIRLPAPHPELQEEFR